MSDLFRVSHEKNTFEFEIYTEKLHHHIAEYFDKKLAEYTDNIDAVRYIEALLFASMIPLHSDNLERQKAMYLIAVQKFNTLTSFL